MAFGDWVERIARERFPLVKDAFPVELIGNITPTHSKLTVTTTSGQALAANTNRKYAMFINNSDTVIYLKLGATAVENEGIRLNANGGSYEMSVSRGNLYTGVVNAVVPSGTTGDKILLVIEGV